MEFNTVRKLLAKGIAEILLVVLGVLIALNINNANTKRLEQIEIHEYLKEIRDELKESLSYRKENIETLKNILESNTDGLKAIKNEDYSFYRNNPTSLWPFASAPTNSLSFPITQEFLNQNFLPKIENLKIKRGLQKFSTFLNEGKKIDEYTIAHYSKQIEPFIIKNINYSKIYPSNIQNQYYVKGGPEIDLDKINALELWNVLTLKQELYFNNYEFLVQFSIFSEELIKLIEDELASVLEKT